MSTLITYQNYCNDASKRLTAQYSTSFSLGIRALERRYRQPICAIYGFVRIADEIVDTFPDEQRAVLLEEFKAQTYKAIDERISTNPVLQAFQKTVNDYNIDLDLIRAFLHSMEMDLHSKRFGRAELNEYVYGSAEVVGLMCLFVFVDGNRDAYNRLEHSARALGSAFQKINFLRDLKSDYQLRQRVYFPGVELESFTEDAKQKIEAEIAIELEQSKEGIRNLPRGVRFGVYIAYVFFHSLFQKIRKARASEIVEKRLRISNPIKLMLVLKHWCQYRLGYL